MDKSEKKQIEELDKIRGSMLGGAAGDALGYPVEFFGEEQISEVYGSEGIMEYDLDDYSGEALISDDTQMSLFTANGILVGDTRGCLRGIQAQPRFYVARAYQEWLRTQVSDDFSLDCSGQSNHHITWLMDIPELHSQRAPGRTCITELVNLQENKGELSDYIAEKRNNSKGCGGVMRVAPLGMRYNVTDEKLAELDMEGAQLAAITHTHPLGYMPAAILVHVVNRAVYSPDMQLEEIINEAKETAADLFRNEEYISDLTELIDLANDLSKNNEKDVDNIHTLGEGWTAEEALAISIYCSLKYKDDFSAGIIAAVNHKGDSDSTGAVTGNILGAITGYSNINDKWKTDLELTDIIIEMADDLCYGCQMSEYGEHRDERWLAKYVKGEYPGSL